MRFTASVLKEGADEVSDKKAQILLLDRWRSSFEMLSDAQAGQIIKAMFKYIQDGEIPEFTDMLLCFFWQDIKIWLDETQEHYKKVIAAKSKAGQASGISRKNKTEHSGTKGTYVDKDKDKDKEIEKEKDKDIDIDVDIEQKNKSISFLENPEFKKAKEYFKEKIGPLRNVDEFARLNDLINDFGYDVVMVCIDIAKEKGAQTIQYLETVCQSNARKY